MNTQTPDIASAQNAADAHTTPDLDMVAALMAALSQAKQLPLRPEDAVLLQDMQPFRFGPDASRQAWSFGTGPVVMLVHGYSGRGVQMAALARHIAAGGYRCVFFDAGGHGASAPERIGFNTFISDSHLLYRHLDTPIHAMIGHSAGGLAMMRARRLFGIEARRYGVIAAPLYPYVPLETMRKNGAPEGALDYIKAVLSDQFQMPWSALVRGDAFAPTKGQGLLALYDHDDPRVRHGDGDALGRLWPGAEVVKTRGHGHNRVLRVQETLDAVRRFVEA